MKILAIGDPHGSLDKLKAIPFESIDLILLTGDIGKADLARKKSFEDTKRKQQGLPKLKDIVQERKEIHNEIHKSTLEILRYLSRYAPVYTIEGNVGIPSISQVREDYEKYGLKLTSTMEQLKRINNLSIVKNRLRVLHGLRVGFLEYFTDTSWVREFKPRDYQNSMRKAKRQTDKAKRVLRSFGKNLDILVCHQPPFGVLDKVNFPEAPKHWQGKHAGSKAVLDYIKKYHPKYVICGHIHESEGYRKIAGTNVYNLGVAGYKIIEID